MVSLVIIILKREPLCFVRTHLPEVAAAAAAAATVGSAAATGATDFCTLTHDMYLHVRVW